MSRLDDELRKAFKREQPSADFAERMLKLVAQQPEPRMCWWRRLGALLEPPFPTVGADEDVYEVVKLLKSAPAVLVRDREKYHGILTRFDVVGHLGGQP